jgi:hypothetical protein
MQIVAAAHSLAGAGGSETYAVTVADHLQRLGHDVWLYSPEPGRSSDAARALGVRVVRSEDELPSRPDVLLVQDGVVAYDLAACHPATPQAFVAHSDIFDLQLPPQLPDSVAVAIVLYDRVELRVRALARPPATIVRLAQPVDVERFKPAQPLRTRPRVAMTIGNYVHGERLALLRRACARAGVELRHIGAHGEGERPADLVLNEADIVFGKARVIVEAMATGRAAYVFDHNGGDGWVTAASYPALAADNFGGQSLPGVIDEERLVADLALYEPGMGIVNRDLAVAHHAASRHAAALVAVLERAAAQPRAVPPDAPLREMARLVRLYHRADMQAFVLRAELAALAARAQHAEELEAGLRAQVAGAGVQLAERDSAVATARAEAAAHAALADRLGRDLRAVTGTRRWRALQAALAPADRLRRAVRARAPASADQGSPAPDGGPSAADRPGVAAAAALDRPCVPPAPAEDRPDVPAVAEAAPVARRDRPRSAVAPRPHPDSAPQPPAPFVVGVPRSGTTLLRLQLDAHPELAIGPETGFGLVAAGVAADGADLEAVLDALTGLDTWPDLGIDRDSARQALERAQPWSAGAGLRELYRALAAREAKSRWGDKTPDHLACMPAIAAALPEARFIHLIRDGRDVAASVSGLPFAPGDGSIEAIAADWRERIAAGRRDGAGLAHLREVRYERLVREPEPVLRELCEFLELPFHDAMLRAHERAAGVLARLPATRRVAGTTTTQAERGARHTHLHHPPDPTRAGRWREALSADEVARFEAVAGDLLRELGYPTVTSTPARVP